AAAAGDVAGGEGLPGTGDVGDRGGVDDGADAAGPRELVQVPEQAEAGDVGGGLDAGRERRQGGVPVEGGHDGDRLLEALAGRLVPVVEDAQAEGLGEREGQPGAAGVVAQEAVGVGDAGDRLPVLGLGGVDAVPAAEHRAGRLAHRRAAAQHLRGDVEGDAVPGPREEIDRDDRGAAHRVDVGQRVGRGDAAEVVGVVDDGGEEVGRGDDRAGAVDAHGSGVV